MINKLKTASSFFCGRTYHSVHGVYGYRPPAQKPQYKIPEKAQLARNSQCNVYRWIEAYRKHGHKLATVNPISDKRNQYNILELQPEFYGLQPHEKVELGGLLEAYSTVTTVSDLANLLQEIYSSSKVSAEFYYIEDLEEREWLAENFEKLHAESNKTLDKETRLDIAKLMIQAQAWENFMALKFPTVKRYSGEGAEGLLAFFQKLLIDTVEAKIEHIVIAMPHRGRTALQTVLFNMRPAKVFRKLQGHSEFPDNIRAMSDVISHFHTSEDLDVRGKNIHVSMVRNSSHLEAANPVSMGKTRSKQQTLRDGAYSENNSDKSFETRILNVNVHGDAALPGQGINQECLNMAYVPHFEIGGTVHLVVNNQVGFTTPSERSSSTLYCTDLAKTIQAPVFHVNGNDPDTIALITQLALDYQQRFHKDVFIDMNCYRRWGHNELDDPTFTNPSIYKIIHNQMSVPDLYAHKLQQENLLSATEVEQIRLEYIDYLTKELEHSNFYQPEPSYYDKQWISISPAQDCITYWDTGLDYQLLNYIGHKSVEYSKDFNVHPHLLRTHIEARRKKLTAGEKIDWATAEALAIGSLMYQGHNVRLSGEDVGRGTFSHRHAMLVDQVTNDMYIPLNDMPGGLGGRLEIAHSILSEEAALAYEYGMAIDNPNNLIIWEAQFGDFANGAQIIIDSFIATSETKWMNAHGLVMLLPHGYDGAASEHSSCRIERFLQLCDSKESEPDSDNVNMQVVNPTTPAQYFHVLRRQLLRNFRKPLVVVAPKVLLRLSAATSTHVDFQNGTYFNNVLPDNQISNAEQVHNIIFCSGKHFYSLNEERLSRGLHDTVILRLESLCPFPMQELLTELNKYPNAKNFIWSQEEHRNQGAWSFVRPRFEYLLGKKLVYCGRAEAPTTATGIGNVHKREAAHVRTAPFEIYAS